VIITGIIIYTIHPPQTAAELNSADSSQLSCVRVPVTLLSFSYQNSSNVSESAAVEAQVVSHNTDDTYADQVISGSDLGSPPADECMRSQQPQQNSPSVACLQ